MTLSATFLTTPESSAFFGLLEMSDEAEPLRVAAEGIDRAGEVGVPAFLPSDDPVLGKEFNILAGTCHFAACCRQEKEVTSSVLDIG